MRYRKIEEETDIIWDRKKRCWKKRGRGELYSGLKTMTTTKEGTADFSSNWKWIENLFLLFCSDFSIRFSLFTCFIISQFITVLNQSPVSKHSSKHTYIKLLWTPISTIIFFILFLLIFSPRFSHSVVCKPWREGLPLLRGKKSQKMKEGSLAHWMLASMTAEMKSMGGKCGETH